jgi:ribosomal protein L29
MNKKTKILRESSPEELQQSVKKLRSELLDMRLRKQFKKNQNTNPLRENRRQIARILTLQREKTLSVSK